MRLATESIRLVSGMAEFCPERSRVQSPPEAPIMTIPSLESLFEGDFAVLHVSRSRYLAEDLRVPSFVSNSINIRATRRLLW